MKSKPRVLVAVLHWGLGHATRCIPLIKALEQEGAEVFIASDGDALHLLREEFPSLQYFELPSYDIRYPSKNMFWNILVQSKNIFNTVKKEKNKTKNIVLQYNIDLIISDNRFGCLAAKCKNVFVTHQLFIQTGFLVTNILAKWVNHYFIRKFDEVWIPDVATEPSLAGKLSHGRLDNLPTCRYLGVLSRFNLAQERLVAESQQLIAIILSGPEPQRSILEDKILAQIKDLPYQFVFFRGSRLPRPSLFAQIQNIQAIFDIADAATMQPYLEKSALVISRSGYTTIMDLALLGKKALLIPTPGQTEQEYLATTLSEKNVFTTQSQDKLNIEEGIENAFLKNKWQSNFKDDLNPIIKKVVQTFSN